MTIEELDHVQVAIPAGGEERARAFYGGLLGLREVAKPARLATRGGVWFAVGTRQLHLGVEADFRPARKAHPALRVRGLAELIDRCRAAGVPVAVDEPLPGVDRVHVADPFGNRLELLEPARSDRIASAGEG
ncbi:MAG TPA: VOC family protein [Thermoanaerobaculia bacterium]